tara:strand:+ start:500 stop:715 length:216 start_codon:yes stop_codon:yes gene_type:complete
MSAEKNLNLDINSIPLMDTPNKSEQVFSGRVDINILLDRVRKEKEKETRTTLVFSGLIFLLILIVGIILSF